jgi:hypothetical protein
MVWQCIRGYSRVWLTGQRRRGRRRSQHLVQQSDRMHMDTEHARRVSVSVSELYGSTDCKSDSYCVDIGEAQ